MHMTVTPHDHIRGNENARVTLIEYSDFECPYCARAHQTLSSLLPKYGQDVRLVYRHFPLTEMHPDALPAAAASEVAGAEGKFWEMHDALFEGQDDLSDDAILAMADAIGLDVDAFQDAWQSGKYVARVERDAASGNQAGVRGTPTFFINGVLFEGDSDQDSLDQALRAALED